MAKPWRAFRVVFGTVAKLPKEPVSSELTPEDIYRDRRRFLRNAAFFTGTAALFGSGLTALTGRARPSPKATASGEPLPIASPGGSAAAAHGSPFDTDEPPTKYDDVTSYNNFYELGYGKGDPIENAGDFHSRPWTVAFDGEIEKPQIVDIDDLIKWFPLEERIYRMRCVETWSMVIPWLGFPLGKLIQRLNPTSRAKYVSFESVMRPSELIGQRRNVLHWPYVEGLRLDEAMNPLTLLAAGLYGKSLLNQNGAPIRLVVPWKYGFKGIKSIVKIRLTETEPRTTWAESAPSEYGFYANVNPKVDHPRWSQATERRVGELSRRPTLPFNGYAEQVAGLYTGLDLKKAF